MHPNTAAAIAKGRRSALEQRRKLKAAGQIDRIWGGSRRAKGLPPLSRDRKVRHAQRIMETRLAAMEKANPPVKAWEAMSRGEKLAASADRALDVTKAYLDVTPEPGNLKLATLQKELALGVIGYQLRAEQLAPPETPVAPKGVDFRIEFVKSDHPSQMIDAIPELPAAVPVAPAASSLKAERVAMTGTLSLRGPIAPEDEQEQHSENFKSEYYARLAALEAEEARLMRELEEAKRAAAMLEDDASF